MQGKIRNYIYKTTVILLLSYISYQGYRTLEYVEKVSQEYELKKCNEDCLLVRYVNKSDKEIYNGR